ncbi:MAG: NAD-dependent epimerase/dehydratase family protein [Terriglobales bacterium]
MRVLVTGGAGFIGSNLAERLLAEGHAVTVYDNLCAGSLENLRECQGKAGFRFVEADLLDLNTLEQVMHGQDAVFHMAANSNIPEGRRSSDTDLRLGTLATYNVLEAMRRAGVKQIVFASSSAIYGEATVVPTPESYGPLFPISLYGASKLACEGLITAFCSNYGMQAWICRFANICGRHGTHGILIDFIARLRDDPRELTVLGDGRQAKPYLHVSECVDGMLFIWRNAREQVNCFNLGCEGATSAGRIAELLLDAMGMPETKIAYGGGDRGWVGDVPQVRLDCTRLAQLGWTAKVTSEQAVKRAAEELVKERAQTCAATSKL